MFFPTIDVDKFNPTLYYLSVERYDKQSSPSYHFHPFPVMMVILEMDGECVYRIDGETHSLETGNIVVINPGVYHEKIISEKGSITELHLGFDNINIKGLSQNKVVSWHSYAITGSWEYFPEFETLYKEAIKEQEIKKPGYDIIIKSISMRLIIFALRILYTCPSENEYNIIFDNLERRDVVDKLRNFLYDNYTSHISLEKIAGEMYLSPSYLSKVFKLETGESPMSYMIKLRLSKAIELLKKGNDSIINISKAVGYDDVYHFSKLFKKYYGTSPSKYFGK